MNYLIALLLTVTYTQAASSALVGGVRRNFDTTGTNTTTSAVTITGTGGTNLNAGTVQATNSVNVGRAGEQGVVQFTSTNSTYTATISLLANGTLVVTNNGVLVATVALSSGYAGAGTLFLSDDGTYKIGTGGATVNPTDRYYPYRSNSTTFGDGLWYHIQTDALGYADTNWSFILNPTNMLVGNRSTYNLTTGALTNTAFGYRALNALTTGDRNLALGAQSLTALTTGSDNVAAGWETLLANVSGSRNVALGNRALFSTTDGTDNVVIGNNAMFDNLSGLNNTMIGTSAGFGVTNSDNVVIGSGAASVLVSGIRNVVIGRAAEVSSATDTNTIVIGRAAVGKGNNTAMIGDANLGDIYLPNVIHLDRSVTNVLYRSTVNMLYTNGATAVNFKVVNGAAATLDLGVGSNGHGLVQSETASLFIGADTGNGLVSLNATSFSPATTLSLGNSGSTGRWADTYSSNIYVFTRVIWNGTTNTVFDAAGSGSPEGAVTASPGSTYRNFAGGATNAFWVKETGNGSTGWINK